MNEGTLPPEKRATMVKQRERRSCERMEREISGAELPIEGLPDWGKSMVLRIAREKCDVLSAAVLAIETGRDGNGDILRGLTNYMAGRYGVEALRHWLERAGVAPGQSNVVPLRRGTAAMTGDNGGGSAA